MTMDVLTVAELTTYLKALFDSDPVLTDLWVQGEVSNCRPAGSGHWYWTLKDGDAQLPCVMWKYQAAAQTALPADGQAFLLHGAVSVYAAQGKFQLYVDHCEPAGMGDLHRRFEALKARLAAEGLFDAERKRPLPVYPMRIGVVTSPDAAALRDVCNVLARRWPCAEVLVAGTLVQGEAAPPRIVAALEAIGRAGVDVVIVCRGGGSLEDLWAFNEEVVARAIAACPVPVVSGVGHETDFTIADFVADLRSPTPTAAAELVTPDQRDVLLAVDDLREQLARAMDRHLDDRRRDYEYAAGRLNRASPARALAERRLQTVESRHRLERALTSHLQLLAAHLDSHAGRLAALNPAAILERGYAHVRRAADGRTVRHRSEVAAGTGLVVKVADGEFAAVVAGQSNLFAVDS